MKKYFSLERTEARAVQYQKNQKNIIEDNVFLTTSSTTYSGKMKINNTNIMIPQKIIVKIHIPIIAYYIQKVTKSKRIKKGEKKLYFEEKHSTNSSGGSSKKLITTVFMIKKKK